MHLELVGTIEDVAAAKAELIEELRRGHAVVVRPTSRCSSAHVRPPPRARGHVRRPGRRRAHGGRGAPRRRARTPWSTPSGVGRRFDFNFTGGHYLHDALAALAAFMELGYRWTRREGGAAQVAFSDLRGADRRAARRRPAAQRRLQRQPAGDEGRHRPPRRASPPAAARWPCSATCTSWAPAPTPSIAPSASTAPRPACAWWPSASWRAATSAGAAGERWFATVDECMEALPDVVPQGSAVLVKASRALRLERVADASGRRRGGRRRRAGHTGLEIEGTGHSEHRPHDSVAVPPGLYTQLMQHIEKGIAGLGGRMRRADLRPNRKSFPQHAAAATWLPPTSNASTQLSPSLAIKGTITSTDENVPIKAEIVIVCIT